MNPSNTWKGKLEAASFFLPSKYLDRQCDGVEFRSKPAIFVVKYWIVMEFL